MQPIRGGGAAAMPPSREAIHDDDETPPLVRDAAEAARTRRVEFQYQDLRGILLVPPKRFPWWRRLPFLGPTPYCVAVGQPLYREQFEMLARSKRPGHFKQLAMDRQVATLCLNHYNSSRQDKYELAPGKVTRYSFFYNGACWTHGNFVARQIPSGWRSFLLSFLLPPPRTLFFFETSKKRGSSHEIVTCTPLDEPVTEAYSVLGFPLGRSKRRSGKVDTICRTCTQRHYLPHPGIQMKPQCEHDNARKICEMCYNNSVVLHPVVFKIGIPGL